MRTLFFLSAAGLVALAACTSPVVDTSPTDTTVEDSGESNTRVVEIGWASSDWTASFDGHHIFYAYDRTNDFYPCRFQWTTTQVDTAECEVCDFAHEVRYDGGEVLVDEVTGALTEDCGNFGLADGHSFSATRLLGFATSWTPDEGATYYDNVLMQYYDFDPDVDGQEPGWYGIAYIDYVAGDPGSLSYKAAYAYYEYN